MRVYIIISLLLIIFSLPTWAADEIYICPMHPHIEGKAGENCPICGMSLVPKVQDMPDSNMANSMEIPGGTVSISPAYVQALGVKTDTVSPHSFGKAIKAYGQIASSSRLEHAVTVREDGWIVDLATSAVGDQVQKGDLLFTYYSPDLMSAQSDFLIGSRTGNAEQRLRLYGMDDKAIAEFKKGGKMMEATPFYATADGTVTMLDARPGMYMGEGSRALTLQDLSKIWVNAEVPIRDIAFLDKGQNATITQPETGETYSGVIDFIHPVANPMSRTVTVRIIVDNADGDIKPETYADVVFEGAPKTRLAVPQEAVLFGGQGQYVMEVIADGQFRPIIVETGITSNGLTEITSGLKQGQRIVTSGQFMIDAESNLRGGMASMGMDMDMGDTEMKNMDDAPAMKMEGGHVH